MSEPFVGQIQIFAFNFAPKGWALCNGSILAISQNTALFSLLGTTYGGNGTSTFALPNLQASVPIHFGQGAGLSTYVEGQTGGEANHTLLSTEMPQHSHTVPAAVTAGRISTPSSATVLGSVTRGAPDVYTASVPATDMATASISSSGSGGSHNNMMPYLVLNYCIALTGIFPARN
jgi:microcystin-dependent protein